MSGWGRRTRPSNGSNELLRKEQSGYANSMILRLMSSGLIGDANLLCKRSDFQVSPCSEVPEEYAGVEAKPQRLSSVSVPGQNGIGFFSCESPLYGHLTTVLPGYFRIRRALSRDSILSV